MAHTAELFTRRKFTTLPPNWGPEEVVSYLYEKYPITPDTPLRKRDTFAWARPARKIAEPHVQAVFEKTSRDEPFRVVDIMSSTPVLRELMTGQFNHDLFRIQANGIYDGLLADVKSKKIELSGFVQNEHQMTPQVRGMLARRSGPAGKLLWSAIFDTLSNPPQDHKDVRVLRETLLRKFHFNTQIQDLVVEPRLKKEVDGKLEKGAWRTYVPFQLNTTLKEELLNIISTDTQVDRWLEGIAGNIAERLAPEVRRVDVISLDFAAHDVFVTNAVHNFEPEFVDTTFFQKAIDRRRKHVRGDVRRLPFEEESISVFTCFEGFPFYKKLFTQPERLEIIREIARALKPDGKAIFFPWHMQFENSGDAENRRRLENLFIDLGFNLEYKQYSREELMEDIMIDEHALTHRSEVIKEKRDTFLVLIAAKIA